MEGLQFRGTALDQDKRFSDKDAKLLRTTKFQAVFDRKVDMRKVELSVMKPWIATRVNQLLGFEDEVVIEYVVGLLEDASQPIVDGKKMQVALTGFLESKTPAFMKELWDLLLSAQDSAVKVPAQFIEQKKEEMRQRAQKTDKESAAKELMREQEEEKARRFADIRQRERGDRRGRGRGRGRQSRFDTDDRRPPPRRRSYSRSPSRSRSPPRRARRSVTPDYSKKQDRPRSETPRYSRSPSPRRRRDSTPRRSRSRSPRRRSPSPRRRSPSPRRRSPSYSPHHESPRRHRSRSFSRDREESSYNKKARYDDTRRPGRESRSPEPSRNKEAVDYSQREQDLKAQMMRDRTR